MTEERQASLLAEWLQSPGTPPPEGLDPEVVQATLALRPEMAPAPSVSLDDILAGVSEGPFAGGAAVQSRSAELPLDQGEGEVSARSAELPLDSTPADLEPANTPEIQGAGEVIDLASRRRRRIWGGLGLLAAAALVLVTVGPNLQSFNAPPAEEAGMQAMPGAQEQMVTERGTADDKARGIQDELAQQAAKPAPPPAPEREPMLQEDNDAARPGDAPTESKPAASPLKSSQEEASYGPPPSTTSNVASRSSAPSGSSSGAGAPASSYDTLDVGTSRKAEVAEVDSESRDRRFQLRGDKSSAAEAPAVADDFAYEAEEAMEEPEGLPGDIDGLRSAAMPRDYRGGWYLTGLDGEAYDRFEAALNQAQGQGASAQAGIYASLIDDPDPRVGQDMAFRAATAASQAGDDAAALSYLRRGQARSSLNTPQRANLYYLEGQIRERQGDLAGAMDAYRVAANMNQAR